MYDRASVAEPDRVDEFDTAGLWNVQFDLQLMQARQREPNESAWRWSRSEPIPVWREMGLQFVQAYIDWRQRAPYEIWTTPDGEPAIELDVSGHLPGCEPEIKGFIDRVVWDPVFEKLIVVDIKSGKRAPKDVAQFATYRALLEAKYGVKADLGVPFMNRKGTLGTPYELAEYTPEVVGKVYAEAWAKVQAGDFPANGFPSACFICDVSAACWAQNGPLAAYYDPDHPGYSPPAP